MAFWYVLRVVLFAVVMFPCLAGAAPISKDQVPELLQPWIGWVLHNQEMASCPPLYDTNDERFCAWPAHLELSLQHKGGRFQQKWRLWSPTWVPLPGSRENWPQSVQMGEKSLVVINREGVPSVYLQAGHHVVSGEFVWQRLPESLTIPLHSGLLHLNVHGVVVPFPNLDEQGKLWLHGNQKAKREEDHLEITVHRKMVDTIPVQIQTRIDLRVAGKNREILLDQPLVENLMPYRLQSPLPLRLEEDGRLRLQARRGDWTIELDLRYHGPLSTLSWPPKAGQTWAQEEVWVFESRNHLRMVSVEGVTQIDPQQTTLPNVWRRFPAYLVSPGDELRLTEKKRGDSDPAPDRLTLQRTWWLDFDGAGYTIHDRIHGTLNRSWRLEMNQPMSLGRVAVNDQPQFITHLPEASRNGVEVRQGKVDIVADSRLETERHILPAVGWQQSFQNLSASLNLPPGWRIFHGSGVDRMEPTWINRWTLLDLFLTLMIALSVGKLFGRAWGFLALFALVLSYHEADALIWPMIHLLVAIGLLRVISNTSTLARWITFYRLGTLLLLILFLLAFLVDQARSTLYPQLELGEWYRITTTATSSQSSVEFAQEPVETYQDQMDEEEGEVSAEFAPTRPSFSSRSMGQKGFMSRQYEGKVKQAVSMRKKSLVQVDPHAQVQTGPGLPQWRWRTIQLSWNGPVEPSQEIHLYLISPSINRVLNLLRMVSMTLLTLLFMPLPIISLFSLTWWRKWLPHGRTLLFWWVMATVATLLPGSAQAELPSKYLLDTLQERLLEPPVCFPQCASVVAMELEADENRLQIQLEVHVAHGVAVPLPGNARHWLPSQVLQEGEPAEALWRHKDGTLQIYLEPGRHTLRLIGSLPQRPMIQIPLRLPPQRLKVYLSGWDLEGLRENGLTEGSLQLRRQQQHSTSNEPLSADFSTTILPAFARLERELVLDLTWRVRNRLVRLSPLGSAMLVAIPLLPGESITTPGVRVVDGKAQIHLGADAKAVRWQAILEERPEIHLTAPIDVAWTETWRLQVSPIWHVTLQGIPVIHHHDNRGNRRPEWRPWPGEQVVIQVSRPEGVPGPTLTLVKSLLEVMPGIRTTESHLTLDLRSSQGNQLPVRLPAKATSFALNVDGETHPVNHDGERVVLPVVPGSQTIKLSWREPRGMEMFFQTPDPAPGVAGGNAHLQLHLPQDRWVLWVGGASVGPAVLFWGGLVVVLVLAVGLGQIPWIPLKSSHWIVLGLGLSTHLNDGAVFVVGWFLLMGWRQNQPEMPSPIIFNIRQLLLALLTLVAAIILLEMVHAGLLGSPQMMIAGNGSSSHLFRWYQDHSETGIARGWVISIPLITYRVLMLLWSLWLAAALLHWMRWAWGCFSQGGVWKKRPSTTKNSISARDKRGDSSAAPSQKPTQEKAGPS